MKSLDLAAKYLGRQETDGPNDGPILREIRKRFGIAAPCSWCALFVGWVLCRAYGFPGKAHLRRALGLPSPFYAESAHAWTALPHTDSPRPGDLVVFLDSAGHGHHIGFVEVAPDALFDGAKFSTIEGNTAPGTVGNQREGDGVYRRSRTWHDGGFVFVRLPDALRA